MQIAVIGAGRAGREFAVACAAAGFDVVLEDVMPEKLRNAAAAFAEVGHKVRLAATVEDAVQNADIVVDFVPDELESKLEIWSMIDRMAPPKTVMCTPSEVLSITDIASCTYRADRCIMIRGLHSDRDSLRILLAAATSDQTVQVVEQLFSSLDHKVTTEADPDLPQLMKNMRVTRQSV